MSSDVPDDREPRAPNAEEPPATKWRAGAVAVGTTLVAVLFTFVAGIAFLVPLFLLEFDVESLPVFLGLTVVGQLGFLLVGYAVARYRSMEVTTRLPDLREAGYAVGGVVVALVLVVALSVVVELLGVVPGSVIEDVAVENPTLLLWIGFLSVVVVAPAEEFLFRGVVQGTLREAFGPVGAVAGASLLFGSLHLTNFTGRPEAVAVGALMIATTGSVLGVLYEVTDNLAVPIAAHATYNVVLSVGYFLSL